MSWIFSFLLLCYVLVRLVLRVRGELRWLAIRDTLPEPPPMVEAPEHLTPPLAELFVDCLALRADLVRSRRILAAVAVKDPDAALGRVRDVRYRRALIEGWSRVSGWLRAVEQLDAGAVGMVLDIPVWAQSVQTITSVRESLRDKWIGVSRSRALEPFQLTDLHAVQQAFERVERELATLEDLLARSSTHPYRDRSTSATA